MHYDYECIVKHNLYFSIIFWSNLSCSPTDVRSSRSWWNIFKSMWICLGSLGGAGPAVLSAGKSPVAAGNSKMEADLAGKIPRWWWFWYSGDGGISMEFLMRVTTSSMDDWRFDSAKRPKKLAQKAGPFSARISSSATGRWIITSSLCDPVKLGSMSPPSLQCGRAKRWGELGRDSVFFLAETMDIILFPIISLEGVSTKWLRYVEVCWGWNTRTFA